MIREGKSTGPMGAEEAGEIGIGALAFLAEDAKLMSRFLALSGIEPSEIRAHVADPAFFAGLLDFILGHEGTLAAFEQASGTPPERVAAAREALGNDFAAPAR